MLNESKMKIDIIPVARPNFMKIDTFIEVIEKLDSYEIEFRLIYLGQHYDKQMSDSFFE